jgi:hypothetical protein
MGDEWIETFDSVFWVTIGTMTFGFLALVIKTALASKCDNLDLCFGCIKIHRAVELEIPSYTPTPPHEEKRDLEELNLPTPPSPSSPPSSDKIAVKV